MRIVLLIAGLLLAGCDQLSWTRDAQSNSPGWGKARVVGDVELGDSTVRYQFINGSEKGGDFVFDRASGCIAKVNWTPDWARSPKVDLSNSDEVKHVSTGSSSAVDSFEPWKCPKVRLTPSEMMTK